MMSGVPLETFLAFNERWNNKFYYKVASCWLFLLMSYYDARIHEYINFINAKQATEIHAYKEFPLRLDYGRSPRVYINQRLQIQLQLLMMSGMPLEIC
jgi:hypothetical protein